MRMKGGTLRGRFVVAATVIVVGITLTGCPALTGSGGGIGGGDDTTDSPPIADAGSDVQATVGQTVTLDGAGSFDPDGDFPSFSWVLDGRPSNSNESSADIVNRRSEFPEFTPGFAGTYLFQLTVTANGKTDIDTVRLTVTVPDQSSPDGDNDDQSSDDPVDTDQPPTADAGADQDALVGDTVILDGTGSTDPDGDSISYTWTFTSQPGGSTLVSTDLSDATVAQPTFDPTHAGSYVLNLTVIANGASDSDTVTVNVEEPNAAPTADAGTDDSAFVDATVTLNAGAADPDGDALTISWTMTVPQGSALTDGDLVDAATLTPSFIPDVEGDYILTLTVSDGELTAPDSSVTITAVTQEQNAAPTVDAGAAFSLVLGETATWTATATDLNDDNLTYSWTFVAPLPGNSSLGNADIDGADTLSPSFLPDAAGSYTLELAVDDGEAITTEQIVVTATEPTEPLQVNITVNSPTDATIAFSPDTFTLNKGAATPESIQIEATNGFYLYRWLIDGQAVQDVYVNNTFTVDSADIPYLGTHTLQLIIQDQSGGDYYSSDPIRFSIVSQ